MASAEDMYRDGDVSRAGFDCDELARITAHTPTLE
jgi:hypothetical protein